MLSDWRAAATGGYGPMSWGGVGAFCQAGAWETARVERHRFGSLL